MDFEIDPEVRERLARWERHRRFPLVRRLLAGLLLVLPIVWGTRVVLRVLSRPAAARADAGTTEERFGLDLAERQELFRDMVRQRKQWRTKAERRFQDDPWSQQDDFHAFEAPHVLNLARRNDLHYSVPYLILDEGIREGWLDDEGHPVPAPVVPLRPRIR
jgi:hypothetical protein